MWETLETRRLLSMFVSLDKGLLAAEGSPGADVITIDAAAGQITVAINANLFTAPAADVKRILVSGGPGHDRISVSDKVPLAVTLLGGEGNDRLQAGRRATRLLGEAGHDTLIGGRGKDVFTGGSGIDTADYSARTDPLQLSLDGLANDGAPAPAGKKKGEADNIAKDVERLIGGSGNDLLLGSDANNTLQGGAGDDTLRGGQGNDLLVGGAGADLLEGQAGDDILLAIDTTAADTLDGGDDFDSVAYDLVSDAPDTLLNAEAEASVLVL